MYKNCVTNYKPSIPKKLPLCPVVVEFSDGDKVLVINNGTGVRAITIEKMNTPIFDDRGMFTSLSAFLTYGTISPKKFYDISITLNERDD